MWCSKAKSQHMNNLVAQNRVTSTEIESSARAFVTPAHAGIQGRGAHSINCAWLAAIQPMDPGFRRENELWRAQFAIVNATAQPGRDLSRRDAFARCFGRNELHSLECGLRFAAGALHSHRGLVIKIRRFLALSRAVALCTSRRMCDIPRSYGISVFMIFFSKLRILFDEVRLVGGKGLRKAPLIFLLSLISVALDLLGVMLIAPFVGLLMGQSMLPEPVMALLGQTPLVRLGVVIVAIFLIKALSTFWLQGVIARNSERIRADVMTRLLASYQHRPYRQHLRVASSELINRLLFHSASFANGFIGAALRFLADLLVLAALVGLIAFANPLAMLLLGIVLLLVFVFIQIFIRDRMARAARRQLAMYSQAMHASTQALGGLREVRILGCESYFLERLRRAGQGLTDASAEIAVYTIAPRQLIEFALVSFIVMLVFISQLSNASNENLLPFLGLMAAAAVRLMPASTSLLTNFNQLRSNRFAVAVLAADLREVEREHLYQATNSSAQTEAPKKERFARLEVRDLQYAYEADQKPVFSGLSFAIEAGETVGLVGHSGAGKSTLADVLLGFLAPDSGELWVNGQRVSAQDKASLSRWQSMVSYIPQQSYLIDDTLRRNVALGVADERIDDEAVIRALTDAQLGEVLRQLPDGLDTQLGERGVRLSGGQRQRVSIARALYHDRDFLVLDEATSALDVQTEHEIVETIRSLAGKKTILLIAHRDTTLAASSRILRLSGGQITSHAHLPRTAD